VYCHILPDVMKQGWFKTTLLNFTKKRFWSISNFYIVIR
jgi:hypothetical protein